MHAAEAQGAAQRHGTVTALMRRPSGAVHGVVLEGGESVEVDSRWLSIPTALGEISDLVNDIMDEPSRMRLNEYAAHLVGLQSTLQSQ